MTADRQRSDALLKAAQRILQGKGRDGGKVLSRDDVLHLGSLLDECVRLREQVERKQSKPDGHTAALLLDGDLPRMCPVRQQFRDERVGDVEAEVQRNLERPGTIDKIERGDRVAIAVGSRRICDLDAVVRTLVQSVRERGGEPFVVPAMGSHGGATAEGQSRILESYGITEDTVGCPIRSSMEAVEIGLTADGMPVFIDRLACESDGVIAVNRIKPHTAFQGSYESGLVKMISVGLGKQRGASRYHQQGFRDFERIIVGAARKVLEEHVVLFGVAIIENACHRIRRIAAIPSERILEEESPLLKEAVENMPAILFADVDVLVVDEVGKDINGDGMDPHVTGRFGSPYASGGIRAQRVVVLDLTERSLGCGIGLGLADIATQRAFDKVDFDETYPNSVTSTGLDSSKMPVIIANDRLAIRAGIQTCNGIDYRNPRIVRIKNTLSLEEIQISEALFPEAASNPRIEVLTEPRLMAFDPEGNLR